MVSVLTVERRYISIKSMEDLANQSEVSYGIIEGGSTMQFFNVSQLWLNRIIRLVQCCCVL